MVIATDGVKAHCVKYGCSLPLIVAVKSVIKQDDDWKGGIKTAVLASENSLIEIVLNKAMSDYAKEHGFETECKEDEQDKPESSLRPESSLGSAIKDLLTGIADKL